MCTFSTEQQLMGHFATDGGPLGLLDRLVPLSQPTELPLYDRALALKLGAAPCAFAAYAEHHLG